MLDLSAEMAELWASLGAPGVGSGRLVQFLSAQRGAGTSTVAREFALYAARRMARSVWLVDLDIYGQSQFSALGKQTSRYGALGPAMAASPDGSMFFTVQPPSTDAVPGSDARYLSAHRVGTERWWVTRFRRDGLGLGQRVHVIPDPAYWAALRRHADLIVVDAPAAARSQAGLTVAPFMDQTVMVVAADQADVRAPAQLRDAVTAAGGQIAGVMFNRAQLAAPPFLKALLK